MPVVIRHHGRVRQVSCCAPGGSNGQNMPLALVAEDVTAGAAQNEAARTDQVSGIAPAGAPVTPGERGRGASRCERA